MEYDVDVKTVLCTVRLTARQVAVLGELTNGELSRSQLVRMLVDDFARKPQDDRQAFVVRKLFGAKVA